MKSLIKKLLLCIVPVLIYVGIIFFTDVFGVFHYKNIGSIATANDDNYIKTRYVLDNPEKFNAFILGSSRVGNLPIDNLPVSWEGSSLNWYNMTYSMGCPKDNLETVKSLLAGGVDVKFLVMGIDEISMYNTYSGNADTYISKQYQEYAKSPLKFYYSFLKVRPKLSIIMQRFASDDNREAEIARFYEYGVCLKNCDLSVPEKTKKMVSALDSGYYPGYESCESMAAIKELVELCRDRGITLKIFTSPVLQTTYEEAVSHGYLDFLKDVTGVCSYYNFSGLNEYTTDMRYYFDSSHYIPFVGANIEKILFDDVTIKDVNEPGVYIDEDNVDELIKYLEGQL